MTRRIPVVATIVVVVAVAGMAALGVWQLQRAKLHSSELAAYTAASRLPPIAFPTVPTRTEDLPLYRYATGNCLHPAGWRTAPGEDRSGEPGYVLIADCTTGAEGPGMSVEVGWSKNPNQRVQWAGGLVSGIIVPDGVSRMRLVAASPLPGVQPSAVPAPTVKITPERNRGYAMTWFGLAVAALVVYALAVRKRWSARSRKP